MNFRHAIENASRDNGPDLWVVSWIQGCILGCPGCFSPDTHDLLGGIVIDTTNPAQEILSNKDELAGVSQSGGDPFQQQKILMVLLELLQGKGLDIMVFIGYSLVQAKGMAPGISILNLLEVKGIGPNRVSCQAGHGHLGSSNQKTHLLTNRYPASAFISSPKYS
jgi:anaerobic ribonucleoside-triphosphate reductase activating protein